MLKEQSKGNVNLLSFFSKKSFSKKMSSTVVGVDVVVVTTGTVYKMKLFLEKIERAINFPRNFCTVVGIGVVVTAIV